MTKENPIVVTVHGGVVQDVEFPAGCKVIVAVHDYDTDGCDEAGLDRDDQGDAFVEALWEPAKQTEAVDQAARAPVATPEGQSDVPAVIAFLDNLTNAEAKSILIEIYRWMYWDDESKCWSLDNDISGADTVQLLCELLPSPPEVSEQGGET